MRKFLRSCDPSIEGFKDAVQTEVANITNYHTHSDTCRKDKRSTYGGAHCRMAKPQPISEHLDGETGPIVVHRDETCGEQEGPVDVISSPIRSAPPDSLRVTFEDFQHNPLPEIDPRTVLWELGRLGKNGDGCDELVVPYNDAFSAVGACNTCIVPLGCAEQAKAVCFYLLKYLTKDPTKLEATQVLVFQAVLHMLHHPSVAEDSGSTRRNTMHLLQRMLNMVHGAEEISSQIAATALLGKPPCFSLVLTHFGLRSSGRRSNACGLAVTVWKWGARWRGVVAQLATNRRLVAMSARTKLPALSTKTVN